MMKFIAGVLSVIAVGVLLIAYGLLNASGAAFEGRTLAEPVARPTLASEQIVLRDDPALARYSYVDRASAPRYVVPTGYDYVRYSPSAPLVTDEALPVRTVALTTRSPRPVRTRTIERQPRRDWKKTALVIGGSSAAGAGVGAIFGGKKGALIGAAIGGGASTIYETTRR